MKSLSRPPVSATGKKRGVRSARSHCVPTALPSHATHQNLPLAAFLLPRSCADDRLKVSEGEGAKEGGRESQPVPCCARAPAPSPVCAGGRQWSKSCGRRPPIPEQKTCEWKRIDLTRGICSSSIKPSPSDRGIRKRQAAEEAPTIELMIQMSMSRHYDCPNHRFVWLCSAVDFAPGKIALSDIPFLSYIVEALIPIGHTLSTGQRAER